LPSRIENETIRRLSRVGLDFNPFLDPDNQVDDVEDVEEDSLSAPSTIPRSFGGLRLW